MNAWHIIESVLVLLIGRFIIHIISIARGLSRDELIPICIRVIEIVIVPIIFWGDNNNWSFGVRYTLLSICMFGQMIRFYIDKQPITRESVFWGIAIPLFGLIIGAMDFKIKIGLSVHSASTL